MGTEILAAMLATVVVFGSVAGVVLLGLVLHLGSRIRRLEERWEAAARRPAADSDRGSAPAVPPGGGEAPKVEPAEGPVRAAKAPPSVAAVEGEPPAPIERWQEEPATPRPAARTVAGSVSIERLLIGLGGVLGALLVLAGALFGVETAIEAGWFGPGLRVSLAALGGAALWGAGVRLRRWQAWLGASVSGAGIGALFGSLFASISLYGFVGPSLGAALSWALVALATLDGVRASSRLLPHLAGIGAVATPLVVADDEPSVMALFLWLLASAVVAATAAAYRRWPDVALHLLFWLSLWSLYGVMLVVEDQDPWACLGPALVAAPFLVASLALPAPDRTAFSLILPAVALPWIGLATAGALTSAGVLAVVTVGVGAATAVARRLDISWPLGLALGLSLVVLVPALARVWLDLATAGAVDAGALLALGLAIPMLPVLGAPRARLAVLAGWPAVGLMPLSMLAADPVWARWGMGALVLLAFQGVGPRGLWDGTSASRHLVAVAGVSFAVLAVEGGPWWELASVERLAPTVALALWAAWSWGLAPPRIRPVTARAAALGGVIAVGLSAGLDRLGFPEWIGYGLIAAQSGAVVVVAARSGVALGGVALGLVGNVAWWLAVIALVDAVAIPWRMAVFGAMLWAGQEARRGGHAGSAWFVATLGTWLVGWAALGTDHGAIVMDRGVLGVIVGWGGAASGMALAAWRGAPEGWSRVLLGAGAVVVGFVMVNLLVGVPHAAAGHSPWADPTLWTGAVRSLTWGAYGGALLALGSAARQWAMRVGGFGFVLLGAGKVFAVDLWALSGVARVFSALGLGGTLLAAAIGLQWILRRTSEEGGPPQANGSADTSG